jgi:non-specific serine/threonine protein kinase
MPLTPREQQVCELAKFGLNDSEVAERLGMSWRTAETHRHRILAKLGVANSVALIAKLKEEEATM